MITKQVMIQSGRVTTEGDDLYYEVRGQGQPLLMIAPAAGDGWHYSFVADILANEYKAITYDRRANARSTMNVPQNFEISQQSRDAVAVLGAAGETSAFVFGNSSGAVIALDMAKTQPQAIRAVVVHEAPLARMHPKAAKWQRFFASVYLTAFRFGSTLGALRFLLGAKLPVGQMIKATREVNIHREQSSEPYIGAKDAVDVLIKQELLPVANYLPDIERIKQNGVRVFIAVSKWGLDRKTWYAQVAQILAEKLGCELVTFPGHHGSFLDMPDEFAATLRTVLHKAD
ncbi:MAG: alpha/beta hydrolase [Chloroflexi bacterium]|nr:alpha/beta hydrolase [Chloroflexota bacterium]MCI0576911.1 alpha/beta hydrolase [Chloroflexota bacterium]MCI0645445.1 alpha/beta hydrolase [Chloroflexota bacterium]MCI0731417.1 alpha/beta hydrolase [Chloroflexota bacterium]